MKEALEQQEEMLAVTLEPLEVLEQTPIHLGLLQPRQVYLAIMLVVVQVVIEELAALLQVALVVVEKAEFNMVAEEMELLTQAQVVVDLVLVAQVKLVETVEVVS